MAAPNAAAAANAGPYTIDGTGMGGTLAVPANATLGISPAPTVTVAADLYGNVKELGPTNGTATKVGVIQKAATPMLDYTNPNGQVDLRRAWLSTARATDNSIWQYFAWERDANSGSGFIAFEFNQKLATGTGCADPTAPDPATCNPWNPRTDGDFMIVWDQSGSSTALQIRYWHGDNATGHWDAPATIPTTLGRAAFNTDDANFAGFKGEAAINLTELFFKNQTGCTSIARVLPNTVTGNSDTADYKDTIFTKIPPVANCGTITITKTVQNKPNSTDTFAYTTTGGLDTDTSTAGIQTTFSLTDGASKTFSDVPSGSYTVAESATLPAGYDFVSLACTATGSGTSVTPTTAANNKTATITMGVLGDVDCTYTNHYTNTTSITTTLSATTINLGQSVHDGATLHGQTLTAGGTVEYRVFKRSGASADCTISATNPDLFAGVTGRTVNVTNGTVPNSPSFTPSSFGSYDFQAVYSGDTNNAGSSSTCGDELVLVKATPGISTTLSTTSVIVGATVYDSATLSNATSNAGGTVVYTVYTDSACTLGATAAGTKTVTNGVVPDSDTLTFTTAGDYYWKAVYSGDANNVGASSTCTDEHLVVAKAPVTVGTVQTLRPQDTVTVSATAGGTPTGKVTFNLYDNNTCTGPAVYTQADVELSSGTASTNNTTFDVTLANAGTFYWQVSYSGDSTHLPLTATCGAESFTVAITNG
ncbi:MAG TPA: hypothetical protein VLS51_01940 [Propionibacteriaceae bacterium]|nr:hypothetical protein [Propionibacteriaceae bacterium]